jgi:hypothetical protein
MATRIVIDVDDDRVSKDVLQMIIDEAMTYLEVTKVKTKARSKNADNIWTPYKGWMS